MYGCAEETSTENEGRSYHYVKVVILSRGSINRAEKEHGEASGSSISSSNVGGADQKQGLASEDRV